MDCNLPDSFHPWNFFRQEYWSGFPCPPPGDLPNPRIKFRSPSLQTDSLLPEPPGKPKNTGVGNLSLLQGTFLTQESNQGLLQCRWILYQLSYHKILLKFGFLYSLDYWKTRLLPNVISQLVIKISLLMWVTLLFSYLLLSLTCLRDFSLLSLKCVSCLVFVSK